MLKQILEYKSNIFRFKPNFNFKTCNRYFSTLYYTERKNPIRKGDV